MVTNTQPARLINATDGEPRLNYLCAGCRLSYGHTLQSSSRWPNACEWGIPPAIIEISKRLSVIEPRPRAYR